jgi:hypothetical protein
MPTVIYCDRVKHTVIDSYQDVCAYIRFAQDEQGEIEDLQGSTLPRGFIAVMPVGVKVGRDTQVHLRASAITTFHTAPANPTRVTLMVDGKKLRDDLHRIDEDGAARA